MLSDNEFGLLLEHLNRPWAGFRKVRKGVKKRLRRHMTETGCSTLEQYLTRMDRQPEVRADCERCLRVTISRFFRDRQLWQALKADVLPRLVSRFPCPLRIWSAGCAGGEEPYSLAMVWNAAALNKKPYLLATDAGEDCLQRARAGSYGPGSLKEVPAAMVSTYFDSRKGGRRLVIRPERLPRIHWQRHELIGPPPEKEPFHLVFLRNNLLTYYRGTDLQDAFHQVLAALLPGGALVVGARERLPASAPQPLVRDAGCPWIYWLETG